MIKNENTETGEVNLTFTGEEVVKYKRLGILAGAILAASVVVAGWAGYSMQSLQAENELYRNQLKLAEQKMEALESKTATVEKISNQLQELVQAGSGTVVQSGDQTMAGGTGGASTVPDKAKKTASKEEVKKVDTPAALLKEMHSLDERLNKQIRLFVRLREMYMNQTYGMYVPISDPAAEVPNIWPVTGEISSQFGYRSSPGGFGSTYHEGLDIAGDYGLPIVATAAGTVTQAGWVSGYGYLVEVKHAGGITTRYGHNSAILAYEGQHVDQGTVLALMGSTGNSTGPHCHYEVRINGSAVDPLYFLPGSN